MKGFKPCRASIRAGNSLPGFARGGMVDDPKRAALARAMPSRPNMLARARRPGGMKDGGKASHSDAAMDRKLIREEYDKIEREEDMREEGEDMARGGWIKGAIKKPGQLHRDLGVPQGQKIPKAKIAAAAKKPGKVGQRARLAQTLSKFAGGGYARQGGLNSYSRKPVVGK